MDLIGEERGRLARAATWLQATRAELVGLVVLLVGAVAVTGVVVWSALERPPAVPGAGAHPGTAGQGATGGAEADGTHGELEGHDDHHHGGLDHGPAGHADQPGAPAPDGEVTVHVSGAVAEPGIVTLAGGARVADAVASAGGVTDDADLGRVNLARPLADGEQVHVPREGEPSPAGEPLVGGEVAGDASAGAGGLVDLNRATQAELETLPGVGPAIAQRILQHREANGPFGQIGDLRDVSGIGEKRFQDLAPLVTVG